MSNKIINNAYRILGLLPNSTTKEISKRIKNLDKLLRIGNIPDFDFDFSYFNQLRTEENVNIIKNILFNPKEQILHYFFSIYLQSDEQVNQMRELEKDFTIEKINEYYNNRSDMITSKNSVLLMYLYLYINKDEKSDRIKKLIVDSLYLWYEIIFSKQFYKTFKALYLIDDEIGISEDLLDTVQEEFQNELVKAYSELVEIRNEPEIIAELVNIFDIKDSNITVQQVEDCYKNIDDAIEVLDTMNISEDGIFDDDEKRTLKEKLMIVQNNLNTLMDYDLYDDSRTIVLRDRIVRIVRNQMIDLHNNLLERKTALNLIDFAIKICGTEGLKVTLQEERKVIANNISSEGLENILSQIKKLFDDAKEKIDYLTTADINILADNVSNLYNDMNISDNEISDIIFYLFRNLSVEISNKRKKYQEGLLLLKLGYVYAKKDETKRVYLKDSEILKQNIENNPYGFNGCLRSVLSWIVSLIGYIIIYGLIGMILASCNG